MLYSHRFDGPIGWLMRTKEVQRIRVQVKQGMHNNLRHSFATRRVLSVHPLCVTSARIYTHRVPTLHTP